MIEGLKPYPKYRNSDVPWLGKVPEHWLFPRLKTVLRERVQKGFPNEPMLAATQTKGVIKKEHFENRTVLAMKDFHLLKLVEKSDFVISLRSFQGGIEFARDRGIISPAYTVLYPVDPSLHGFLAQFFKSKPFVESLSLFVTGIRQGQNIDYSKLSTSCLPLPPPDEQRAIVRFLDHAERKIRRYIAAKRKLIKLLEEEKQAIIHRAVTRGLDPNVRLKPSDVEWLGDIPDTWSASRFKQHVRFQEGPGIMASDFRESGVPLLRISCLKEQVATLDGCNFLDPAMVRKRWGHFIVQKDDYLLSASASTGKISLASEIVAGAIPYTGIIRLWPAHDSVYMPYVDLFVKSRSFQDQIDSLKSGVGIEHFGPTHLSRIVVALPSYEDQKENFFEVERLSSPLSKGIDTARDEILFLEEYRTRLISDVVTGKLDVREAAAALPDEPEDTLPDVEEDVLPDEEAGDAEPEEEAA